jgi:probable HAF family extracellular repeat protein
MIVGQSRNSQGHVDAFSFATGTMTDLGAFIPFAINNSGAVAGELLAGGLNHACVYGNGTITDLGTLGGSLSAATGINSAGMIAGWSDVAQGGRMAFSYTNGTMTSLGTLGGPSSQATGINSSGAIVGFSYITPNSVIGQHGFVFSNGKMTDICTLGGLNSYANAINDSGVVVGTSERAVGDGVAFVYKDGAMTDLNTLVDLPGFSLISAMGINDGGQIVADGMIGGTQFGVLLTPIPEPSAYAAVLGATALGFVAYRRRQLAGR